MAEITCFTDRTRSPAIPRYVNTLQSFLTNSTEKNLITRRRIRSSRIYIHPLTSSQLETLQTCILCDASWQKREGGIFSGASATPQQLNDVHLDLESLTRVDGVGVEDEAADEGEGSREHGDAADDERREPRHAARREVVREHGQEEGEREDEQHERRAASAG